MTKTSTILIAFLLIASGSTAVAAKDNGKKRFQKLDLDGDGAISLSEFQAAPHKDKAEGRGPDVNGDGQLTLNEMEQKIAERSAAMSNRMMERFERMDIDGDGVVTPHEAKEAMFHRLDTDDNGEISKREMRHAKKARTHRRS